MATPASATTPVKTIDADPAITAAFELLHRCRRRLVVVAAVRRAGISVPIAIALSETIALVARPAPVVLWTVAAAAVGVALIIALGAAMMGAPSLRGTAAALDARLRLQDRMVTALQVATDDDPMATLVLRDVAVRIAGVSPSQTFPLEPPDHFRAIGVAAIAISTVFVVVSVTSPAWRVDHARQVGSPVTGGAQRTRGARSETPEPGANAAPAPSDPRPAGAPQVAARATEPAVGRDLGRSPTGLRAAGPRRGSEAASAPAGRETPGAAVPAGAAAAGRGAAGASMELAQAAGGVKGESLRNAADAAADESRPASPLSPGYAARYRTASARAQAAIAQERVPAGLANYVKNYFIAIKP
jgi:hypothetical protein